MAIQNNQPDSEKPDKSKLMIMVIVGLAVLLLLAQKFGCGPVKTEEKIEWIDR